MAAGAGALIGVPVVWMLILRSTTQLVVSRVAHFIEPLVEGTGGLGCDAAPERFAYRLDNGGALFAYDSASGSSRHPDAPPLDLPLFVRSQIEGLAIRIRLDDRSFGELLYQRPRPGPCGLMYLRWAANPARAEVREWLLVAIVAGFALAFVLAATWVVRPLLRRIGALAAAADDLGTVVQPPLAIGVGADELARVGQRLLVAHQRIRSSQQAIEAKNQALAAHLAQITHDLRSPLASLQLTLEDLQTAHESARPWVGSAIDSALYIEGLCENLNIASQLREGLVPPAPTAVDVAALVDRVVARLAPLARHRGVDLVGSRPDGPVQVAWLGVLAERLISNLVDNAIRHGRPGGHVAVVLDTRGDRFELVVADDGPGVTDEALARAREPWVSPDGHGLGLRITFMLAEQAGLELELGRDADRGGTCARLTGRLCS